MQKRSSWYKGNDDTIVVDKINGKPKKVTGTRFASLRGENHWKTPFQAWCELTRVAEPEFADNKYTLAGKAIEPKLIDYCKSFISPDITTPEDVWGEDFFNKTYGDFFKDDDVFGGMWDATYKLANETVGVIECKTSSRPQDWEDGVPTHYAQQGWLYAYLLGVDTCYFAVAFLEDKDYEHPEDFVCTDDNTTLWCTHVPYWFEEAVTTLRNWYHNHVVDGGISPAFDEKKDKEYLTLMRTMEIENVDNIEDIIKRMESVESAINYLRKDTDLDRLENEYKVLTDKLKSAMMDMFTDETYIVHCGGWSMKKNVRKTVDTNKLKKDGIYESYVKESESYRLAKVKE